MKTAPERSQHQLDLPKTGGWGGKRKGAGRRRSPLSRVQHRRRPLLTMLPVHVTLRVRPHVWNLRSRRSFRVVSKAFVGSRAKAGMQICHFSVQGNHIHLVVEAATKGDLARCMQGLEVRLARGLNQLMGKKGSVFAGRYHSRPLRTPTEVRNAVGYVVGNAIHARRAGKAASTVADVYSSAVAKDLIRAPGTWLMRKAMEDPPAKDIPVH